MALAVVVGAGSAALSWFYARRVIGATSGNALALATTLKRVPEHERLAELARRAPPKSWEQQMATEALEAREDDARIAVVNDALSELDHALRLGATWPGAAMRIAVSGTLLLGIVAYISERELGWMLAIFAAGAISAVASLEAQRSARRHVAAQRAAVDALVDAVFGRLSAPAAPPPGARRRRK